MIDFGALASPVMDAFGVRVLYGRPGDPPFHLRAVFDRFHEDVFGGNDAPSSTRRAHLVVRLAAFPPGFAPRQGDRVNVALRDGFAVDLSDLPPQGVQVEGFTVMDVQPDGGGAAILPLSAFVPDPLA
jgi:hypothetical protein